MVLLRVFDMFVKEESIVDGNTKVTDVYTNGFRYFLGEGLGEEQCGHYRKGWIGFFGVDEFPFIEVYLEGILDIVGGVFCM